MHPSIAPHFAGPAGLPTVPRSLGLLLVGLCACSPDGLPPVSATAPSEDERILAASPLMSDGTDVPGHSTSTVETSEELISDGLIGGLSVAADGTLLSTDFGSRIWSVAAGGQTTMFSDEFEDPSGNLMLDDGDLLQSEWTSNKIYRVAPDGSRTLFCEDNLDGPVAIVQRPEGDFVVANSRGQFLARVPAEGGAAEVILEDGRVTQPNGLTIDDEGNIYIADLDSPEVFRWSAEGELTSIAELPGRGNAHHVWTNGRLYVNKIWDHAVYLVNTETGAFGLVSGTGLPGYDDGANGEATLEEPNAIALAPDGQAVFVNTHRGTMGRNQVARLILRKIEAD